MGVVMDENNFGMHKMKNSLVTNVVVA